MSVSPSTGISARVGELERAMWRRYPLMPFRGRLTSLRGSADRIPDGALVDTREGVVVRVHPDGMYGDVYLWGDYEPYNTKIYRRLVRPGDVVFDVGANFGWFTTLFARWAGPTGHVHAFEPVPFIGRLTAETVASNHVDDRVTLNHFGLGRANDTIVIHTFEGMPHGHATASGDLGRDDAVPHRCEIRTLDDYCRSNGVPRIDFVKVDVEGFEPDVFLGGGDQLRSSSAPIIAFEINTDCLAARSLRPRDVVDVLRGYGYSELFTWSTRHGVRWVTGDELTHGDYVAGKAEHRPRLRHAARAGRLLR